MTAVVADLRRIGLCWHPSGQAGLRGPLLALADSCDRAFVSLAVIWNASEERHPASLPAAALQRVDYLHSFPHQASLSARLDPAGLTDFLSGEVLGEHGEVAVTRLSPIREVLTPAACYHLYNSREGESLDRPLYLTTRNTCFATNPTTSHCGGCGASPCGRSSAWARRPKPSRSLSWPERRPTSSCV